MRLQNVVRGNGTTHFHTILCPATFLPLWLCLCLCASDECLRENVIDKRQISVYIFLNLSGPVTASLPSNCSNYIKKDVVSSTFKFVAL